MEDSSKAKIEKILGLVISDFFRYTKKEVITDESLEERVIADICREFSFNRQEAESFYRVAYWVLCSSDDSGAFIQRANVNEKGMPVYIAAKEDNNNRWIEKIIEKYGPTLNSRLDKAKTRAA